MVLIAAIALYLVVAIALALLVGRAVRRAEDARTLVFEPVRRPRAVAEAAAAPAAVTAAPASPVPVASVPRVRGRAA